MLCVVVDQDGGVSLDDVAEVSQAISSVLDQSDAMGSVPYVLEVTSPGIDRPLTEVRHWKRAAGRLVSTRLVEGGEVTGRVRSVDERAVVLEVDGEARTLEWPEVAAGQVQIEFQRRVDAVDGTDSDDDADATGDVDDDAHINGEG
jgi:ribosome maturation factor RimP